MNHPGLHDALEGIAIIGMAGRFPGAHTIAEFWQHLRDGVESIVFFSDQELQAAGIDPALLSDANYVKAYGLLEGIEFFDAPFFGVRPREAEIMDPQQRFFLECAWEALESAGYDAARYDGAIGVYAGVGVDSYALVNLLPNHDLLQSVGTLQTSIRNRTDHLTTQVAYKLNLRGPGVTVQTACSTSLVAVHLACQSLLNGECDMALAGGVSIAVAQKTGYRYHEGGILSPDGHCRAFDAKAQGCVGGSGVGIVVLKRLEDAVADGDCIYAVIKGSAINNDGAVKVGYTAPSVDGQAAVIAEALELAGVHPETVTYIEAHGTGTALGDPIEIAALTRAFRTKTARRGFCALGAVKTNIGHLDTAAGVAGLIKTVLALKHTLLPPSLHFQQPNPRMDFETSPFYVNTTLSEWPAGSTPRRAGVSSFGLGGTNAHVVLEEAPTVETSGPSRPWQLLLLSAKTSAALESATARLAAYLTQHPGTNLADVAYTLQVGRRVFGHRRAIVCRDASAVPALEGLEPARVFTGVQEPKERSVVFMFPGQGAQYVPMGLELYQEEPTFRAQIDRCADLLTPHLGLDLREVLYPCQAQAIAATETLKQTYITQPALFMVEYALAQLWMAWGVQPEAMIGHSIGEYVAACLAGVFSLEDALALVAARGRLMQSLPGGTMLAVRLAEKDVSPLLDERLALAAINGPTLCVVSGPTEAVAALEQQLTTAGVGCRRLQTSHAFHSSMMDPILDAFTAEVQRVRLHPPHIPYLSNVTGTWIDAAEATEPRYWARHLRQTVRFAEGMSALVHDPDWVLLEVGPGQTLMTMARWHPQRAAGQVVLTSLRPADYQESDMAFLLTTLGRLWLAGVQADCAGYYAHERRQRLPLPTYPFERQRYWIDPPQQGDEARMGREALRKKADIAEWFYAPSWKRSPPLPFAPGELAEQQWCWLIFVEAYGLGARLVTRLEQLGQDVCTVMAGEEFRVLSAGSYMINPRRGEDSVALLHALRAHEKAPVKIGHFWGVTPHAADALEPEACAQSLERGFYSLLLLAQALGTDSLTGPLHIGVVTNNMQEVLGDDLLYPEKATVIGPCRAIPKEYAHLTCQSIDIALPPVGSRHEEKLVDQLIAELTATPSDVVVAYRGQHRWVQAFESVRLDGHTGGAPRLRDRGVYLITGGLGGIGLALAAYLARTVQARLILTGRSAFPAREVWGEWLVTHDEADEISRKIRHLQTLEQLGAEVLVLSADVANEGHMGAVIARIGERFGPLHGVIHAAGVAGGGMMQLKTPDMAASTLAPKIRGTRVLEALCQDMPLDFLALCSSRAAILGGFGQADYGAANAFLDAFAHYKTSRDHTFTVSINWGAWQEVGMRVNTLAQLGLTAAQPAAAATDIAHPLLEKCIYETPQQAIYVTAFQVAKHWVLDDHRIVKKAVIPGVAYLEMARAALEKHAGNSAIELRDVFFLTPVGVRDDESREVRTVLEKDGDGFAFRMLSKSVAEHSDNPSWQECAFGKAGFIPGEQRKRYKVKDLIERCNVKEIIPADEPMTHDDLGPRWQNLQRAYIGNNELLTVLELSEAFSGDLETFKFHPALLDRTNGAAKTYLTGRGLYMPMSYKSLQIKAPLPRKIYAYHTYKADKDPSKETITFDVVLMDEHGLELVHIEEFSQRKVHVATEPIKALTGATTRQEHPHSGTGEQQDNRVGEGEKSDIYQVLGEGMSTQEGVEAFRRILSSMVPPQVVVSPRDFQVAMRQAHATTSQHVRESIEQLQLSRPIHPRPDVPTVYVAPRNAFEQCLASIWQESLGIEAVGIDDNFFELGGDSVVGIQMIAKFRQAGFPLTPQQLFQYQTIAGIAAALDAAPVVRTATSAVTGPVPLTPHQRWLCAQHMPTPHACSQAIRLEVRHALETALVETVLQQLLGHHDALRLRFVPQESGWQQSTTASDQAVPLTRVDVSALSDVEQEAVLAAAAIQTSLNLSQGPPIRVVLFDPGSERSGQLLIVMHALAVDSVSWRILLTDLTTASQQLSRGDAVQLPPRTASFMQWAERLAEHAPSAAPQHDLTSWLAAPRARVSRLPVDTAGGTNTVASARAVSVALDVAATCALVQEVPQAYQTRTAEVLLTAMAQALAQWTGERVFLVDLESDEREAMAAEMDLSRTVGACSAFVPILLEVGEDVGPGDLLQAVKEQLRGVLRRGMGGGGLRSLQGDGESVEHPRTLPEAEVRFAYLDQLDQALPASAPFGLPRGALGPVYSLRGNRRYMLEVNAFVLGGQLHLDWLYSEQVHRRETVEHLAQVFVQVLRSLITHCQHPEAGGYTPSDFPLAAVDQQQLDRIMARVNTTPKAH